VPYTLKIRSGCEGGDKGALIQKDKSATLSTLQDQTLFQPVAFSKSRRAHTDSDYETWKESQSANTLNISDASDVRTTIAIAHKIAAVDCRNGTEDSVNGALQSGASRSLNCNNVVRTRYIVRRLTPLECERLQGYPDGWTDIGEWVDSNGKTRQTSDAARYKALGNSIALPPWKWVLKRLCACYERDATMASLFDGIGGFPYLWEQLNGKGSCLWASEIEEFPMAVTKVRIGE
jgi:DNA (cytosine-5)-methyltransferase 1